MYMSLGIFSEVVPVAVFSARIRCIESSRMCRSVGRRTMTGRDSGRRKVTVAEGRDGGGRKKGMRCAGSTQRDM